MHTGVWGRVRPDSSRTRSQSRTVEDHGCHIFWNPILAGRLRPVTGFFAWISVLRLIPAGVARCGRLGHGGRPSGHEGAPECQTIPKKGRKKWLKRRPKSAGNGPQRRFPVEWELAANRSASWAD